MIDAIELKLLKDALTRLAEGYADLPDFQPQFDVTGAADVLRDVALRMHDNYPYYHAQYAGQMLKPPHPVARIAYAMSLWVNPNNHALDGGRASSAMEMECVTELGRMYGWERPLGHLTGGGTMANLEALWVAGRLHPGRNIVASTQAHYTHSRITDVLGLPFEGVPVSEDGRMDIDALEALLKKGDVGTVVVTMGNTGLGAVDPLPAIVDLQRDYEFRIHADAAYGGYFVLASELREETRAAYEQLAGVDSIVVDPHKHGLQPYGCGSVLFKDPSVGKLYKHDSPFTYFSSAELHLGEISLECSRPGASAVALWATQQLLPLIPDGEFAAMLDDCLKAARQFWSRLRDSIDFVPLMQPELDIVVYAATAPDSNSASKRAHRVFEAAANHDLHLALIELPAKLVQAYAPEIRVDSPTTTCIRSVLMKPEHLRWLDTIVELLEASARASR